MLWLSSSLRYFLYGQATDMRCGIYSLAGLVANSLKQNPLNGDVFIFIGKRGNQIRLLLGPQIKLWLRSGDKDGYAMYIKRLEKGTFERPSGGKLELSAQELRLILEGIQLSSVQQRKRYQQPFSAYSRENKG